MQSTAGSSSSHQPVRPARAVSGRQAGKAGKAGKRQAKAERQAGNKAGRPAAARDRCPGGSSGVVSQPGRARRPGRSQLAARAPASPRRACERRERGGEENERRGAGRERGVSPPTSQTERQPAPRLPDYCSPPPDDSLQLIQQWSKCGQPGCARYAPNHADMPACSHSRTHPPTHARTHARSGPESGEESWLPAYLDCTMSSSSLAWLERALDLPK